MNQADKKQIQERVLDDYQLSIHRFGRISSAIVVIAILAVPAVLTLTSGVKVEWGPTAKGLVGVLSFMLILSLVEFFSYAPLLGSGGLYLAFITGNVVNVKLPAALSSVKIAEVEEGSKEAEIISLIAIAVSSIVTVTIITLGMVLLGLLLPIMQSPTLKPAFDNLMPALMGALATPIFLKDKTSFKTASVPSLIAIALTLGIGFEAFSKLTSIAMPVFLAIAVLWRYVLYKRELKQAGASNPA